MTNVTHLCYIFINKYKNLSNIELAIDPRYKFEFDPDKKVLNIECQNILPKDFWGQGIYSLTGIFGNNGAGKSNSIRFILEAIVEQSVDGIIVCKIDDYLYVYSNNKITVKLSIKTKVQLDDIKDIEDINTFYYSGYFVPDFNYNNILSNQQGDYYNASIGYRFFNDIEKFANTTANLTNPISTYLASYNSQNNYRICNLLINDELRKKIKKFNFPSYLLIKPNSSGQTHLKIEIQKNKQLREQFGFKQDELFQQDKAIEQYIIEPIFISQNKRNEILAQFIHHCLLNKIAEMQLYKDAPDIFDGWYSNFNIDKEIYPITINIEKNVLQLFHSFVKNNSDKYNNYGLDSIDKVLTSLDKCIHINDYGDFYLDFNKDKEKILDLIETAQNNNKYLATRFFDLYYSHEKNGNTTLSSGEQAMLNLFSLIYDAVVTRAQNSYSAPSLLILDEAELGFHPEWQRNFISMLVKFVNSLQVVAGHDFQIILTSHSPILLSDIPTCCCNYLENKNSKTINVKNDQPETFSNNVFELYRNSFFLQDGLIGCFAAEKLEMLEEDIKKGKDGVVQMINLIGDRRLKMYFEDLFLKYSKKLTTQEKELLIEEYQERINQLRKQNNE